MIRIPLTHWGRVTHICVSKLTIIGSDNGLSPGWRQAIIWTNACILLIGPLGTNFNEISIEIHKSSFKKIHFKMSSGKWRPSCLGLNVLTAFLISEYSQSINAYTTWVIEFISLRPGDTYMSQWTVSSLVYVMACCLFGTKPLPKPMLT